jgi:hypothetical protein
VTIAEMEVYLTSSGLGRAAIVRRLDGLFCIYKWAKLPAGYMPDVFAPTTSASWRDDRTPLTELYKDKEPLIGIYGTVDDARRELLSQPGFADAYLAR